MTTRKPGRETNPQKSARPSALTARQRQNPITKQIRRRPAKPVVLVIDDDPWIREMNSVALTKLLGVRTLRAATNAQAFQKLTKYKVNAIISDLNRPGGTGFDFLRSLKEQHLQTIPVIISSGNAEPTQRRRAKHLGAFAFLPKPYDLAELAATVNRALQSVPGQPHSNPRA